MTGMSQWQLIQGAGRCIHTTKKKTFPSTEGTCWGVSTLHTAQLKGEFAFYNLGLRWLSD